ncbi:glutathione peroxidase [Phaffia rhodozyma]|uniref:Glutathione peroxidase n=1 Tax=Phaffia rhodozyma TaxID=264483 RepID=A0A0F7SFK9_PHARH|nr:glutathione peroxidase [Phaffia rhodozyma]
MSPTPDSFYSLVANLPKKKTIPFSDYKGKVVLVVNTASKCGFTPQYKALQALYTKYADQGLAIVGFPCDQFGNQEPDGDDDITTVCEINHGVTFPLAAKSNVNGDDTNEVFKYLKTEKPGLLGTTSIKWNFTKFLIDRNGNVEGRYSSTTKPESMEGKIQELLAQK